jgi:aryl-phospho-beta-D-glucosidase BglC (GH1 family)
MKKLFTLFFVAATMLATIGATAQNQAEKQKMMQFDYEQMIKQLNSKKPALPEPESSPLRAGAVSFTALSYSTIPADGTVTHGSLTAEDNMVLELGCTGTGYRFSAQAGKTYKITCTFVSEQSFDDALVLFLFKSNIWENINQIFTVADNQTEVKLSGYHVADVTGDIRILMCDFSSNDMDYTIKVEAVNVPSYTEFDYSTVILADGVPVPGSFTENDAANLWGEYFTATGYSFTPEAGKTYKITCKYDASQKVSINAGIFVLKGGTLQGNEDDRLEAKFGYIIDSELTVTCYFAHGEGAPVRLLFCDYFCNGLNCTITIEEIDVPSYTELDYIPVTAGIPEQGSFNTEDDLFTNMSGYVYPGKGYIFTPEAGKTYKITCMSETSKEVSIFPALYVLKGGTLQGNYDDLLYSYDNGYAVSELMLTGYFTAEDNSEIRLLLYDFLLNDLNYTLTIKEVVEIDRTRAFDMNKRLGSGVNLGNMFEAPSIGEWGVEPDAGYFSDIMKKGFKSIRLPVNWSAHAMTAPPYTIDKEFMDTIKWAVSRILANELPVVLNIHNYDGIMEDPAAHKERFLALWDQISDEFKNSSQNLFFEILNEPNGNLTPVRWNRYLEEGVAKIREKNPERMIIIGTANYGNMTALDKLLLPDDPNIILTIHYYNPVWFTLQGEKRAGYYNYSVGETWGTAAEVDEMKDDMAIIKQYADQNNVPVYIGEFGVTMNADELSKTLWIEHLRDVFNEYGFSSAYWQYFNGIYDDTLKCHYPKVIKALTGFNGEVCDCTTLIDVPIVKNSTFDEMLAPWIFYLHGGNASVSIVNGEARAEIVTRSNQSWHFQFYYGSFPLKEGYTYTLTFDAYASQSTTISTSIGKSEANWDIVYSSNTSLTTTKKKFTYKYIHKGETLMKARILFEFGTTAAKYIYFDNVYLSETPPPNSIEDNIATLPKCTVKAGENIFTVEGNAIEAVTVYDISGRVYYTKKYQHAEFVEIKEGLLPSNVGLIQVRTDVKSTVVKNFKGK